MDLPIEDGWDLICDSTPVQLMQPTPKTCPLSRPDFSVQPRLQARWQVSPVPVIGVPKTTHAGPRLTVAGLLDSEPKAAPAYQPIRSTLSHHVSCVGSPYLRTNRTEYHPESLTMRTQQSMSSDPLEPKMVAPALS